MIYIGCFLTTSPMDYSWIFKLYISSTFPLWLTRHFRRPVICDLSSLTGLPRHLYDFVVTRMSSVTVLGGWGGDRLLGFCIRARLHLHRILTLPVPIHGACSNFSLSLFRNPKNLLLSKGYLDSIIQTRTRISRPIFLTFPGPWLSQLSLILSFLQRLSSAVLRCLSPR